MRLKTRAVNIQTKFRLKGLKENYIYTEQNTGKQYSGAQLMNYGITIERKSSVNDYESYLFNFI